MFVFLLLSSDIKVKTWPLPRTVGLVCVGGGEGEGGGGGEESRPYNNPNIYHDPAIGYSIS